MIIFDQLRISDDGKKLYINLHVNKADYFDNIYLDSITIMAADKVSETNPDIPTEDYIYKKVFTENVKEADLVLTSNDFNESYIKPNLSNDLLFVYVKVKGVPNPCTPCRLDEEITLGVTFDETMLYQKVMQFTRELNQDCEIPQNFLDLILLWYGFKAAIETEHYTVAIDFWKRLFGGKNTVVTSKGCGCHG